MSTILFYLALPFLYLISILPFPIFYVFSDGIYFLLYKVIGYRNTVVAENLKNSFPDKTPEELKKIEKQFYHYIVNVLRVSKNKSTK